MTNPNPLVNKNNEQIGKEEIDRLKKLAMEDMGVMIKIKNKKKKDEDKK